MSYNPGITDRSGEIMAQGISSAANSISNVIDTLGQRHRQLKAFRTMAVDGLGMDKDQVDNMNFDELQGIMQGEAIKSARQHRLNQAAELQAKTQLLQQQRDEADAMGAIAPRAQAWAQANPGKAATTADVLGWMGDAKLSPRTQSAVLAPMVKQLMAGAGDGNPQSWTSPTGNPYVFMGKQLLPDRKPVDAGALEVPEGFEAVTDGKGGVKYLRTSGGKKMMTPAAQTQLTQYLNDYTSANDVLNASDDELKANPAGLPPAQLKASATARLKRSQQNAQNLLKLQNQLGALDDDQHQGFLQQFGLGDSAAAPKAPAAAGNAGNRVTVWDKNGKQYTVPAEQKDQAVAAGYSLTGPK